MFSGSGKEAKVEYSTGRNRKKKFNNCSLLIMSKKAS